MSTKHNLAALPEDEVYSYQNLSAHIEATEEELKGKKANTIKTESYNKFLPSFWENGCEI